MQGLGPKIKDHISRMNRVNEDLPQLSNEMQLSIMNKVKSGELSIEDALHQAKQVQKPSQYNFSVHKHGRYRWQKRVLQIDFTTQKLCSIEKGIFNRQLPFSRVKSCDDGEGSRFSISFRDHHDYELEVTSLEDKHKIMQLVNQIIYGNIYSQPVEVTSEAHPQSPTPSQSILEGLLLLHRGGLASFKWVKYEAQLHPGQLILLPLGRPTGSSESTPAFNNSKVIHLSDGDTCVERSHSLDTFTLLTPKNEYEFRVPITAIDKGPMSIVQERDAWVQAVDRLCKDWKRKSQFVFLQDSLTPGHHQADKDLSASGGEHGWQDVGDTDQCHYPVDYEGPSDEDTAGRGGGVGGGRHPGVSGYHDDSSAAHAKSIAKPQSISRPIVHETETVPTDPEPHPALPGVYAMPPTIDVPVLDPPDSPTSPMSLTTAPSPLPTSPRPLPTHPSPLPTSPTPLPTLRAPLPASTTPSSTGPSPLPISPAPSHTANSPVNQPCPVPHSVPGSHVKIAPPSVWIPPPPPPPPPLLFKPKVKPPAPRTKAFHWDLVGSDKIEKSFWKHRSARKIELDTARLYDQFAVQDLGTFGAIEPSHVQHIMLSAKIAHNFNIFLKSFPVQPGEVKDKLFIVHEADGGLSDEQITSLRRYVPTPDDVEMYKSHKGPLAELHIVDQYMMEMCNISYLSKRLDLLLSLRELPVSMKDLQPLIDQKIRMCMELHGSGSFVSMLEYLLVIGNYLNKNAGKKAAKGFRLSSLSKLVQLRGRDRDFTLLHALVEQIMLHEPGLLLFIQELAEFETVPGASIKGLTAEVDVLKNELQKVVHYRKTNKKGNNGDEHQNFSKDLKMAIGQYKSDISVLSKKCDEMKKLYCDLLVKFGEPMDQDSQELFGCIYQFLHDFKKIHAEFQ